MKLSLSCALFFLSATIFAQTPQQRNIAYKTYGTDSASFSFNDKYYLIEDTCASITRYCHFDFQNKKFTRKFTDVNKQNPTQIICEGNYNEAGQKDGLFTEYYLNGKLQAKGSFADGKFIGKWEFYYETGNPRLDFQIIEDQLHIINAWDTDGKRVVKNGYGTYSVPYAYMQLHWSGKIFAGLPNGLWQLMSDNPNMPATITENFTDGKFEKGGNEATNYTYTNASHIAFITEEMLPLVNAEKLKISSTSCDLVPLPNGVVNAKYSKGEDELNSIIRIMMSDYVSGLRKGQYFGASVYGVIDENGALGNLRDKGNAPGSLVYAIKKGFPIMESAKIDGKPVKQTIIFTLSFGNGLYNYGYQLLPPNISLKSGN